MSSDPPPPRGSGSAPSLFLSEAGGMGEHFRSKDWASTPLGDIATWPQSLRLIVSIMLGSHQPMFVAWGEGRTVLYNDGYVPLLGMRHPAALGSSFSEVWYDILADIEPILDRAYAGHSTHMDDISFTTHRNGYPEEAHFSFSYTPIREETGEVAGMFCVCAETTEQVRAQRQRVDEAERLRRLFDRAPGFIAALRGPDHVFEMMNEAYLQLVGHRNLIGKPVREALPEVDGQGFFELLDEVYRSGNAFTGQAMKIELQRTPGAAPEERLVDFVFQPIGEASGQVSGIFAQGYDVTERHLAETALRESEERFRLIADSAPVPMWVTKLDRRRSFVNRAYVDFLGISYEQAVDFDWRTIIHPDDAPRILAESIAGEASLQTFTLEGRYRGAGGWRWVRSVSQPRWGREGEHIGFIGVAHDITELREVNETLERRVAERTSDLSAALDRLQAEVGERLRAEEALRQAQKMEAVGQLTGGIAHDFNNLLTPILGGLELIASKVEDERLKRVAGTALESARRGAKLTGQLLAFSRIQRISMAPICVNEVIERMEELLRHSIGGAISVETRFRPDAAYGVCDSNQLENAILNLAINARDAMPDGGTLTISTGRTTIEPGPDTDGGDFICVSVTDTGEGMASEVLARATEPFFSTKPLGKGTGLGLAQVYGIARQSGGTLRIESEPGVGTSVHILLPAADPPSEEAGAAPESATPAEAAKCAATILVIDDDDDVRAFLGDSLEGLGHCVVLAGGGEEGLALLADCAPDLVLLDYAMPGMHGGEVARAAREIRPDIPIVFVTGYAETRQLEAALGPDVPVLRKPFSLDELASSVARSLAPKAPAPPSK